MARRRLALASLLGLGLALSGVAVARPRPERGKAALAQQSSELLSGARTALGQHDPAAAYRLATQALRATDSPEALFVLGQVAVAEGRPLDAHCLMRRYLADPNLEVNADSPEQKEAQQLLLRLRPAGALLSILGDRGTMVAVDGRLVGVLPLSRPLLVSAGEHKVLLERHGSRLEDQVRVPIGRLGELRSSFATKALVLTVLPSALLIDESTALSNSERGQLDQALESTMLGQRLSPLSPQDAADCGEPAPGSCTDPLRCQLLTAQRCESDYILRTRVLRDPSHPGQVQVELELYDVSVGDVAAKEQFLCTDCTATQTIAGLTERLPKLVSSATARPRGRLEVVSAPAGATVSVDGRLVGVTPYQATLFGGAHQLELKKEGYADFNEPLEIFDNKVRQVVGSLRAVAAAQPEPSPSLLPPPPPPSRSLWRLLGGGLAAGSGVVLGGFGISALVANGRCVDPTITVLSNCQYIFDSQRTGVALLTVGSLLAVGGVVLLALPPLGHKPSSRRTSAAALASTTLNH